MMKVTTIGLDIAKQVFQVHGADKAGRTVLRRKLRRSEVARFFSEQPPCLVGIEASGSAHYWARVLGGLGHTVRLMAPQFVKPYVKSNKNDANDAEAICEAVTRPSMRFVPQKSVGQQDLQCLHRVRSRLVACRTQLVNQIRGLLAEYGIVLPQHPGQVRRGLPTVLEDAENQLTG
jgi:transposase